MNLTGIFLGLLGVACGATIVVIAGYAFQRPQAEIEGLRIPPKYLTHRSLYWTGFAVYSILILILYSVIVFFYKDFEFIYNYLIPLINSLADTKPDTSKLSVTMILGALVVASLLFREFAAKVNPLLLLRNLLHTAVSIPRLVHQTLALLKNDGLFVPDGDQKKAVERETKILHYSSRDLSENTSSPEYRWSKLCYMYCQILVKERTSSVTFLSSPELEWEALRDEYSSSAAEYAEYKRGYDPRLEVAVRLAKVDTLRQRLDAALSAFGLVLALVLIRRAQGSLAYWRNLRDIGIRARTVVYRSDSKYVFIFSFAIIVSVVVAHFIANVYWYWPEITQDFFENLPYLFGGGYINMLVLVTLAVLMYVLPISVVLLARWVGSRLSTREEGRYWGWYLLYGLVGVGVAS